MPPTGLYPRGAPRPTLSRAEQAVHRALGASLPAGWTAWHSLRIRTARNLEGEGDFVLAIPDRGILVLEVKGGSVEVKNGLWLQNGRPMGKPPRDQGLEYSRKLRDKLREVTPHGAPWIAVATALPDTPFSEPPSAGDLGGVVIGQQDLPYLREALLAMVDRLFVDARPPVDAAFVDALHALWCETWTPRLTLGGRARLRERELVALDQPQLDVLDMVEDNARCVVYGGPGTGKTLLARDMVERLRARGARPVYLCFTSALASGLRTGGLADAWTVRELAAALLEEAGVALQDGAPLSAWTPATWESAPLRCALDALPAIGPRFDAVVVDEGQDLSTNDWELVKALAGAHPLWCFADGGQSFWADRAVPAALFPASVRLQTRYRCPESLARFADRYRPDAARESEPSIAATDELRVVRAASAATLADEVAREVERAIADGAAPSDIAVLSLAGQTRTRVCATDHLGDRRVVRADAEDAPSHVVADTFLRFKGLERPWVIVTELSLGETRHDVRMHVALTRATVGCVVVATAEEIGSDPRLAAVAK